MRTIYLAGPEVFLPDAAEVLAEKRRLARQYGFEVTGPGSDEKDAPSGVASAHDIYIRNQVAMDAAEFCLANITPFRSISADVGTVYEIGYMVAKGRKVWAYSNDHRPYADRVWSDWHKSEGQAEKQGKDGKAIESHGMKDNLMIDAGIALGGGQVLAPEAPVADIDRDMTSFIKALDLMSKL